MINTAPAKFMRESARLDYEDRIVQRPGDLSFTPNVTAPNPDINCVDPNGSHRHLSVVPRTQKGHFGYHGVNLPTMVSIRPNGEYFR
jgi:hypothetical protein